jgi:hypothetical protein
MKNVFIYEKTYVFISVEPLCKLFEQIITFILNYKKLNFYQQLEEYSSLLNSIRVDNFAMKNSEHVNYNNYIYNLLLHIYRQVLK